MSNVDGNNGGNEDDRSRQISLGQLTLKLRPWFLAFETVPVAAAALWLPHLFYAALFLVILVRAGAVIAFRRWQFEGWRDEEWASLRRFDFVALGVVVLAAFLPVIAAAVVLFALVVYSAYKVQEVKAAAEAQPETEADDIDQHEPGRAADLVGRAARPLPDMTNAVLRRRQLELSQQRSLDVLDAHCPTKGIAHRWWEICARGTITLALIVALLAILIMVPVTHAIGRLHNASMATWIREGIRGDKHTKQVKSDPDPPSTTTTTTTSGVGSDPGVVPPDEFTCTDEQNQALVESQVFDDVGLRFLTTYLGVGGTGVAREMLGCLEEIQKVPDEDVWYQVGKRSGAVFTVTVVAGNIGVTSFIQPDVLLQQLQAGEVIRVWPSVSGELDPTVVADPNRHNAGEFLQVIELGDGPEIVARYNAPSGTNRVTVRVGGDDAAWIIDQVWARGNWLWPRLDNGQYLVRDEPSTASRVLWNVSNEVSAGYPPRTVRSDDTVRQMAAFGR